MNEDLKVKFFKFYDFLEDGDFPSALEFFKDPLHFGKTSNRDAEYLNGGMINLANANINNM